MESRTQNLFTESSRLTDRHCAPPRVELAAEAIVQAVQPLASFITAGAFHTFYRCCVFHSFKPSEKVENTQIQHCTHLPRVRWSEAGALGSREFVESHTNQEQKASHRELTNSRMTS